MSSRIATFVVALAVAGTVLAPASSQAQAAPGPRFATEGSSWITLFWNQVLDKLAPLSDVGGFLGGSRFAPVIGIPVTGHESEGGSNIDGNGRAIPEGTSSL